MAPDFHGREFSVLAIDTFVSSAMSTAPLPYARYYLILGFVLLCALVVLIDWATLGSTMSLTRERGGIETMSMLGYVTAVVLYISQSGHRPFWPVPVILGLMALRELDADKRFTSEGLLSIKIFGGDTPGWEKLLAIVLWAIIVLALLSLARHRGPIFVTALRQRSRWALILAAAILIAAASKSIDGLGRKLAPLGIDLSDAVSGYAATLEELWELAIPVLFMLAMTRKRDRHREHETSASLHHPAE